MSDPVENASEVPERKAVAESDELMSRWREAVPGIEADIAKYFNTYTEQLIALCRIPSVSSDSDGLTACAEHLTPLLESLGFSVEHHDTGQSHYAPLILAHRRNDPNRPTLLIYGHYDVQPAAPESDWTDPPFEPTIHGDLLYGRGTADDKGQFFCHFKAIECLDRLGIDEIPNLTIVLDSQEEIGSPRLAELVTENRSQFEADFVFCADGESFPGDRVALQHGNRGSCFVTVTHRTGNREVHSGVYGGVMRNAATELVAFLSTLVDDHGVVQIKGFYDDVLPPSDADRQALDRIPFDSAEFLKDMGVEREFGPPELSHWEKIMFRPTINIAGLSSGHQGEGSKTIIPCEASAKIDMRIVKNQSPEEILRLFRAHAEANGMPDLEIQLDMKYRPARSGIDTGFGLMVRQAVETGFPNPPVTVPVVGGSNPNYIWTEILGLPVVEATYAQADPRVHAPDERFSLGNFRSGILTSALVILGAATLKQASSLSETQTLRFE